MCDLRRDVRGSALNGVFECLKKYASRQLDADTWKMVFNGVTGRWENSSPERSIKLGLAVWTTAGMKYENMKNVQNTKIKVRFLGSAKAYFMEVREL